jgi:small ligand-binding sensory domain FIST
MVVAMQAEPHVVLEEKEKPSDRLWALISSVVADNRPLAAAKILVGIAAGELAVHLRAEQREMLVRHLRAEADVLDGALH